MLPAEPSAPPGGIAPVNITRATVAFTAAESHDGLSCAANPLIADDSDVVADTKGNTVNYWLPRRPGAVAYLRLGWGEGKTIRPNGRARRHSDGQSGTRTGADLTAAIALANASKGVIAFPVTAIRSGLRGDDREVRRWRV